VEGDARESSGVCWRRTIGLYATRATAREGLIEVAAQPAVEMAGLTSGRNSRNCYAQQADGDRREENARLIANPFGGAPTGKGAMSRRDQGIRGRWRIVESETWDQDALDLVGEAHITFGTDNMGDMELICIRAAIDYRVERCDGQHIVEFSFDGFDEMDPISGRGRGRITGDEFIGKLFIHQGDESEFLARRDGGRARPNKGAVPDRAERAIRVKPAASRRGRGG
jgi:hypothetical protein